MELSKHVVVSSETHRKLKVFCAQRGVNTLGEGVQILIDTLAMTEDK